LRSTLRLLAPGATILPMTAAVLAGRPGVTTANQDVYVASFRP